MSHTSGSGDGTTAAIEASLIDNEWKPDRRLNILRAALPPIRENILNFEDLGKSNVRSAFGSIIEKAKFLDVVEFRSGIFINNSNASMEFIHLPDTALHVSYTHLTMPTILLV